MSRTYLLYTGLGTHNLEFIGMLAAVLLVITYPILSVRSIILMRICSHCDGADRLAAQFHLRSGPGRLHSRVGWLVCEDFINAAATVYCYLATRCVPGWFWTRSGGLGYKFEPP